MADGAFGPRLVPGGVCRRRGSLAGPAPRDRRHPSCPAPSAGLAGAPGRRRAQPEDGSAIPARSSPQGTRGCWPTAGTGRAAAGPFRRAARPRGGRPPRGPGSDASPGRRRTRRSSPHGAARARPDTVPRRAIAPARAPSRSLQGHRPGAAPSQEGIARPCPTPADGHRPRAAPDHGARAVRFRGPEGFGDGIPTDALSPPGALCAPGPALCDTPQEAKGAMLVRAALGAAHGKGSHAKGERTFTSSQLVAELSDLDAVPPWQHRARPGGCANPRHGASDRG